MKASIDAKEHYCTMNILFMAVGIDPETEEDKEVLNILERLKSLSERHEAEGDFFYSVEYADACMLFATKYVKPSLQQTSIAAK